MIIIYGHTRRACEDLARRHGLSRDNRVRMLTWRSEPYAWAGWRMSDIVRVIGCSRQQLDALRCAKMGIPLVDPTPDAGNLEEALWVALDHAAERGPLSRAAREHLASLVDPALVVDALGRPEFNGELANRLKAAGEWTVDTMSTSSTLHRTMRWPGGEDPRTCATVEHGNGVWNARIVDYEWRRVINGESPWRARSSEHLTSASAIAWCDHTLMGLGWLLMDPFQGASEPNPSPGEPVSGWLEG